MSLAAGQGSFAVVRRIVWSWCALALALTANAAPALAQAPADSTHAAAPAPPDSAAAAAPTPVAATPAPSDTTRPVLFLREVLVTGSRHPRAFFESPQALSFVSRARLEAQAPMTLGDVLGTLPGVDVSKDSPWEQRPILRGLGGQRVLVLVDGNPLNSARGNGPHPALVDPSQVERVEVVRGPSSVAYGSDALGGAINIITREPPLPGGRALRGSATVGASSVDRGDEAHLELIPRLGRLTAYLAGGGRRVNDFRIPNFGKVPQSSFKDWNAIGNLRYPLAPHLTVRAGVQLYRGIDIGLPGLKTEFPGFLQEFQFPNYDRDAARLTLEHDDPEGRFAASRLTAYWQREGRNFFSHEEVDTGSFVPQPGVPDNAIQYTDQERLLDLRTIGLRAQTTFRRTERYLASAGLDLAQDRTDGDNIRHRHWDDAYGTRVLTGTDRITASIPDGTFGSYAAFSQWEWFVGPRWTVHGGGRFTHYRYRTESGLKAMGTTPAANTYFAPLEVDDSALSGSLGAVFAPFSTVRVTANLAHGYRQPNAQDLFFDGPASVGTVLGNPALQPEKSVSYDLGLRWGPGNVALSGNAYVAEFDDLIDAVLAVAPAFPGAPATYQYVNISSARTMGVELEGEAHFLRRWQARLTLAAQQGDITSPQAIQTLYGVTQSKAPLPNVPPFKGMASIRWRDRSERVWVEPSARWSWRTNRLPLPTPGVPAFSSFKKEWLVGDFMVGARLPRGQRFVAGVRNISNCIYRQAIGSIDEPGRSFVGRLTVDF